MAYSQSQLSQISKNISTYISAIKGGTAWPDYINDAKRIVNEVRGAAESNSQLKALLSQFDTIEAKYAKAYEGLSPMQRPSETAGANDYESSNNIHQQATDSGKTAAQIAKEGLDARMSGGTYTPATNQFLDYANQLKSQGKSNGEIKAALEARGATGSQITSTFSDLGVSLSNQLGQSVAQPQQSPQAGGSNRTFGGDVSNQLDQSASTITGNIRKNISGETIQAQVSDQPNANVLGASGEVNFQTQRQQALAQIATDVRIPDALKSMFSRVVQEWNPELELNFENVVQAFTDIKDKTIDPYFAEQTAQFTNDMKQAVSDYDAQAAMENEQVQTAADTNIRNTRSNLEASGMTFTGEGVKELGAQSAFARDGSGPMPNQVQFGGGFEEGRVPASNRVMATSTAFNQRQRKADLARQAEKALGSQGLKDMNMGMNVVGDVTSGSIDQAQQQAYGQAVESLYNQNQQNVSYSNPVSLFS